MEEGCHEIRDRVRAESYCLLENYGPRRLSWQWPSMDGKPLITHPEGHRGMMSAKGTREGEGRSGRRRAVDKNVMENLLSLEEMNDQIWPKFDTAGASPFHREVS